MLHVRQYFFRQVVEEKCQLINVQTHGRVDRLNVDNNKPADRLAGQAIVAPVGQAVISHSEQSMRCMHLILRSTCFVSKK